MITNNFNLFKKSLESNDKHLFDIVPKCDLHTHALLSSNRKLFELYYNRKLDTFIPNDSIQSISNFIKNNIIEISTTKVGQLKLFECSILTAIDDGVCILDTSVDYRLVFEVYDNNINNYINDLYHLKNKYKDKIKINFDLGISRNAYKEEDEKIIISLIKSKVFNGIDLFGDELSKPITVFKNIYDIAKKYNLILKAHVGEFGTAEDIIEAIKILNIQVVQHGIAIVNNVDAMKFAREHNIIFNVCPISNLKLKRVSDIKNHPIKTMLANNLKVTINTDDQLIFENSLFDEYNLLYKNNVLSINQLYEILQNSFN